MTTRLVRIAGWAAILSGIAAILAMVTLVLFFWLEAPSTGTSAAQDHLWGPLSDLCPIIQMALLLLVAYVLFLLQRPAAPALSLIAAIVGAIGMLGVMLLQALLLLKVIPFEQEVGPVVFATGMVGVWILLVNFVGRAQDGLPSRLTWLGVAVGAAFVLEPVLLFAAGGGVNWRAFMSNYLLLAASAVIFLVAYVGFPIWAIWLGRVLMASGRESARVLSSQNVVRAEWPAVSSSSKDGIR